MRCIVLKILIDMDDTIEHLLVAWIDCLNSKYGLSVKPEEVTQELLTDVGRGVTILHAEGAFTHTEKIMLETVVSSYEVSRVIEDAKKIDPNVFINVSPVKFVVGNFKKKTIA